MRPVGARRIALAAHLVLIAALVADAATRRAPCLGDFPTRDDCASLIALPELVLGFLLALGLAWWWRSGVRVVLLALDGLVLFAGFRYGPGDPLAIVIVLAALIGFVAVVRQRNRRREAATSLP